jgi:hypothetical protein
MTDARQFMDPLHDAEKLLNGFAADERLDAAQREQARARAAELRLMVTMFLNDIYRVPSHDGAGEQLIVIPPYNMTSQELASTHEAAAQWAHEKGGDSSERSDTYREALSDAGVCILDTVSNLRRVPSEEPWDAPAPGMRARA